MIFQEIKRAAGQRAFDFRDQAGVTLLLSTLVLSAIAAVAFSVAAVVLVEVKTSGDVARTDAAYYNDQGIAEEAIFAFKRRIDSAKLAYGQYTAGQPCSALSSSVQGPVSTITSRSKRCLVRSSHIFKSVIPTAANSYDNGTRFFLYDPSFLVPGNQQGGYSKLRLNNLGNASLTVYLCRLDTLCDETIGGFVSGTPTTLGGFGAREFSLQTTQSYELVIKNNSSWQEGSIQIETYGPDNVTPKGLPYVNKESVEIESTRGSLTRRVEVLVPTQ